MKTFTEQAGSSRPYIVVGDKTSKGGVVFTGSSSVKWTGKGVARVGDRATCGCNHCKHRGFTIITSGSSTFKANGVAVARDGDSTDCGAVLMDTGGAAFAEANRIAAAADAQPLAQDLSRGHGKRFLMKDSETGKPLPQRKFIAYVGAFKQEGTTDGGGYAYVDAPEGQVIELHAIFHVPSRALIPEH